jgi:hemoglobin
MDGFNVYQAIGGTQRCRQLSVAFYARVKRDPILRPLFPGKTLKCAIEEFAAFLAQLLGGPAEHAQRRWWLSLRESHLRFKIGQRERDAWMRNMIQALQDVPMEEEVRAALGQFFERSSAYVVNVGEAPGVAGDGSILSDNIHQEISRRWSAQLALDEAVAAVRSGSADRAIAIAEGPALQTHFKENRSVFAALLATILRKAESRMLDYARGKLLADPVLARQRYYNGRTLLHGAAAAGDLATVELLLHLGAEPDITDAGGHTPLYSLANECKGPGGAKVVQALVQAGAHVDACEGVKHCTPLHMAARRGNRDIAEALLDYGAGIEVRDSQGETPLRRAVNCNKTEVAALLLARGADMHSKGSKRLTPMLAARTASMRKLLQNGDSHSPR